MSVHNNGKNAIEGLIKQGLCGARTAGRSIASLPERGPFCACASPLSAQFNCRHTWVFVMFVFGILALIIFITLFYVLYYLWQILLAVTQTGSSVKQRLSVRSSSRSMAFMFRCRINLWPFKTPIVQAGVQH